MNKRVCRMLWRLAALLAALAPPVGIGTARAEVDLSYYVALSAEYDDNVYLANQNLTADSLGRIFSDFGVNWLPTPSHLLVGNYLFGGKLYLQEHDQDTAINQLQLGYTNYSIESMYLGTSATGKLRNIRDAQEDYLKFIADLFVGRRFWQTINAELRAEYSQFDFRTFDYYDYWTQAYGLELRYDHQRDFSIGTGYRFSRKTYPINALQNVGPEEGDVLLVASEERRYDNLQEISLFGRYQSLLFGQMPFLATGTYLLQINNSNSYGDSYINHRFLVGLSQDLFEGTNLHLLGVFQLRDASEKVLIPHSYAIEEDDENYNQFQVRLTHGFTDYFRIYASYSRYWSMYEHSELNFAKNLYALGVAFSF